MSAEKIGHLHVGKPTHFVNDPTDEGGPWVLPSQRKVGLICLIITESALFAIFVVAYVYYMGKSLNPPFPRDVIGFPSKTPWLASIALFASSFTIVYAEKMMHKLNRKGFLIWWGITMALGTYFILYSAFEWYHLIYHEGLTISVNVFGSTFYSLVGLHLSHVFVGLILLGIIFVLTLFGKIPEDHIEHTEMISWYWHFVDAIWVVVLTLVYFISVRY
jgi:cytochrome c oxidase subunit 3/cytochrome o ubiquinol oxidase subunit 3